MIRRILTAIYQASLRLLWRELDQRRIILVEEWMTGHIMLIIVCMWDFFLFRSMKDDIDGFTVSSERRLSQFNWAVKNVFTIDSMCLCLQGTSFSQEEFNMSEWSEGD